MDTSLPQPVRLSVAAALAAWRDWSPRPAREPEPVGRLTGGRSNTSVLVTDGSQRWVVRIDGFEPGRLGLDRDAERQCLVSAAAARLAPRAVYRDPARGVLVCAYLEPDEKSSGSLGDIADLLRDIHALPAISFRLDPLERANRYLALAGGGTLPDALIDCCARLAAVPGELRLCHNDLLAPNRLRHRGRLMALDWEYAAMGDPWFDLAAIIEGDELGAAQADRLHATWLQREPSVAEQQRLADQRLVYRELSALWERVPRGS